jgi:hypothetical protein
MGSELKVGGKQVNGQTCLISAPASYSFIPITSRRCVSIASAALDRGHNKRWISNARHHLSAAAAKAGARSAVAALSNSNVLILSLKTRKKRSI